MKKNVFLLILLFCFIFSSYSNDGDNSESELDKEKISYTLGYDLGKKFSNMLSIYDIELDMDLFLKAIKAAINEEELLVPEQEMLEIIRAC